MATLTPQQKVQSLQQQINQFKVMGPRYRDQVSALERDLAKLVSSIQTPTPEPSRKPSDAWLPPTPTIVQPPTQGPGQIPGMQPTNGGGYIPLPSVPTQPAVGPTPQPNTGTGTQPAYGRGNPSPNLIERYREVYNRPEVQNDPNRGSLLWDPNGVSGDSAGQKVYNYFMSTAGREPTSSELAKFTPIFQGSYTEGNAAISAYLDLEAQKPGALVQKAPQYSEQVNKIFQSNLGREATADELTHFGTLLASGNVDAYGLQEFVKGTDEYQTAADKKFRGSLATELEGYDTSFFNKAKENVLSRFAQNGTLGSSALDFALTDLMGQIAEKRGSYLADLSARQYGGNKDLALSNYRGTMDRYLDETNAERARGYSDINRAFGRSNDIQDYYTQMRGYRQSQDGRNVLHTKDWIGLGLAGANTAAQAYTGYQTGKGFNYFDY